MKLEIFEINQIAIFQANRLMDQDLVGLDCEKTFRKHRSGFVVHQ